MFEIPFFSLKKQHSLLEKALAEAFERVMSKGWFVMGEEVQRFEAAFAAYNGARYCISCGNGTDALELALETADVGAGAEVIVPANTWVSVAEAVVGRSAAPVFADSVADEYTIDPESVSRCITEATKAVIVVHQYGKPARLDELLSLCRLHNLVLIEDCAHAHGAEYQGAKVGTLGDFGCFSFYPTKNLGCLGDGGAVLTNSPDNAKKLKLLTNHGQVARNEHTLAGRNSRLDELQAAFLNVKLRYLDRWNQRREEIAGMYVSKLNKTATLPMHSTDAPSVFHQFVVQVSDRDAVAKHLRSHGIGTAVHYPLLIPEMAPYVYCRKDPAGLAVCEMEKAGLFSLPVFPELTDKEVEYVVKIFNEAVS